MNKDNIIFGYKKRRGLLYRVSPVIKILCLLPLSILAMLLSLNITCAAIIMLFIFSIVSGFSVKEILTNIKPALYYFVFLYFISIVSGSSVYLTNQSTSRSIAIDTSDIYKIFYPNVQYVIYSARLVLVMQLSALLFCTTTSIEIKDAIGVIETVIRLALRKLPFARGLKSEARISVSIALAISFIPEIMQSYYALNKALTARGYKKCCKNCYRTHRKTRFEKMRLLLFALLSLSLHKAAKKAKALSARGLL